MFWKYGRQYCFILMELGVLHYINFLKVAAKLLPGVGNTLSIELQYT
jgi:hypothetical protein